jgi:hypothetical protein
LRILHKGTEKKIKWMLEIKNIFRSLKLKAEDETSQNFEDIVLHQSIDALQG